MLSACGGSALNEVPDKAPQVSVATINGLGVRKPTSGVILAPAAQLFNPNSNTTVANRVPVALTSSDERQVVEVTLILRQGQTNGVGDVVYDEVWRDTLSADADEEIFRNPFNFVVPFKGKQTGLTPAELEIVATDDKGQDNKLYQAEVQVDGSLPIVRASVPQGPQTDKVSLSATVSDPESGIQYFEVYLDGETVFSSFTVPGYSTSVDTAELGNGSHSLSVFAINGVNEAVFETYSFKVSNNKSPEAQDDEAVTAVNTPVSIDILANDSDPDGDPLVITGVTAVTNGTVTILGGALVEYTPNSGFTGTDIFSYTIRDGNGGVSSARVAVTVGAAGP
ncbi:hypothetical protein BH24DEI2_BH24DEI2_01050 [soil metagenome]